MRDPILYSTIRQEPALKPKGDNNLPVFYDRLTSPASILVLISVFFTQIHGSHVGEALKSAAANNSACILYLMLVVLTALVGIRIIQSVMLAKRDYAHVPNGVADIIYFLLVALFCSGALLAVWDQYPAWTLGAYVLLACGGFSNFAYLYALRIPRRKDQYDYSIERRIQGVNSLIFAVLALSLSGALYVTLYKPAEVAVAYGLIGINYPLIIYNMLHSSCLTMRPKFLYHNNPDAPKNLIVSFRERFGSLSPHRSDEEIRANVLDGAAAKYQEIKTVRATRRDVATIRDALVTEFRYLFAYIFGTKDEKILRDSVEALLTVGGGFGGLGYTYYYFVVTNKPGEAPKKIGLFKIEVQFSNRLYDFLEKLLLLLVFFPRVFFKTFGIFKRARIVARTQPEPEEGDIRLTYFIVFPDFRQQHYGALFMQMLKGSVRNHTNDIEADKISLYIREKNTAAQQLFTRAGFVPVTPPGAEAADPLAEEAGKLIPMEWNVPT